MCIRARLAMHPVFARAYVLAQGKDRVFVNEFVVVPGRQQVQASTRPTPATVPIDLPDLPTPS